jgi:hypothetical protein
MRRFSTALAAALTLVVATPALAQVKPTPPVPAAAPAARPPTTEQQLQFAQGALQAALSELSEKQKEINDLQNRLITLSGQINVLDGVARHSEAVDAYYDAWFGHNKAAEAKPVPATPQRPPEKPPTKR